jgi:Tfp pilus assembly protein PilE
MVKKSSQSSKTAFSLIELSIILVIIGILVSLITAGSSYLITSARISNARSATSDSPVANIDGLIAWYEVSMQNNFLASEGIDGKNISTWYDHNPSSFSLKKNTITTTASTNVKYNIKGINQTPSIDFSQSGKMAISNFYQGSFAQATIFIVFKPNSVNSTMTLLDFGPSKSTSSIAIINNQITLNAGSAASTSTSGNPANFIANNSYILNVYFNGSNSKVYVNDVTNLIGNGSTINPGSNIIDGLTIGATNGGSSGFIGQISEVIIFNRPLNATDRKYVMKYLSKKYQIIVNGL